MPREPEIFGLDSEKVTIGSAFDTIMSRPSQGSLVAVTWEVRTELLYLACAQ